MAGADGTVTIDLLFPANKEKFNSDYQMVEDLVEKLGENTGDKMDSAFEKNTRKVREDSKQTSKKVKSDFDKPIEQKIKGDSTNLNESVSKAKTYIKRIPKEVKTELNAQAKLAGIENFDKVLKKIPRKQRTELISKAEKGEAIDFDKLIAKIPNKKITNIKLNDNASPTLRNIQKETKNTGKRFSDLKQIIIGSAIGATLTGVVHGAVTAIKNGFGAIVTAGNEFNKEQQVMLSTWTTLTGSAEKGKAFVSSINDMSRAFGQSNDLVNELDQQFYHVLDSKPKTEQLTKSVLTLADTLGLSGENTQRLGLNFTHMMTSGMMQLGDFNMIADQLPMFGEQLLKYERQEQHNNALSMADLRKQMSAGKISAQDAENVLNSLGDKYKDASENMMKTAAGAQRSIKSQFNVLAGALVEPFSQVQNPIFTSVSHWVSDPKVKTEFGKVGSAASKGFSTISTAFAKALDVKNLPHSMDDFMANLANNVRNLSKTIANHAPQIIGFFKGLWSTVKIGSQIGIGFFKGIIDGITAIVKPLVSIGGGAKSVKSLSDNLEELSKHKNELQTFGRVLAGIFIASKVFKMVEALMKFKTALMEISALNLVNPLSKIGIGSAEKVAAEDGNKLALGAGSKMLTRGVPIAAGGMEAISALQERSTGGKIGGVTGSVAGATGGAALGSMILPGLGTALGASAGAWVGEKFGSGFGKSIQKSMKAKPITVKAKVKTDIEKNKDKLDKAINPTLKKLNKSVLFKMGVDPKSISKTQEQANSLFNNINKKIDAYYSNKEKKAKKDLDELVKNGYITQKQADERYNKLVKNDNKERDAKKKSYSVLQKDLQTHNVNIQKIQNNQSLNEKQKNRAIEKENKRFTKEYVRDNFNAQTQINRDIQRGANQQKALYEKLRKDRGKLDIATLEQTRRSADKEYKATVKSAQKARNEVVANANDKYRKVVSAAEHEYKDTHSISKTQYEKIVDNAKRQRDDTRDAADDQYRKVTKSATKQHSKVTKEIEKQKNDVITTANEQATQHAGAATGEMTSVNTSYSDGFKPIRTIWNGAIDGINSILNGLHKGWGNLPHWKAHATGSKGLLTDEIALVGEEGFELAHDQEHGIYPLGLNGPEIRPLMAGTSILPHDMSKQFLKMTSVLPAHKDGVFGALNDAFDWVKGKVEDGMEFVSAGAEKVFDWIANKVGLKSMINSLLSGTIHDFGQGTIDTLQPKIIEYMKGLFKKYEDESAGNPGGAGVQRWRPYVEKALKALGLSTSEAMVNKVLRQINTESGGNPNAVGGTDGLADGRAMGLMQVKPKTFAAYGNPKLGPWNNGYASIYAGLNYALHRYGRDLSFLGNGHGYENGGEGEKEGWYKLFEGNKKEFVIPADSSKADRGYEMLGRAAAHAAIRDNLQSQTAVQTQKDYSLVLSEVNKKLNIIAEKQLKVDAQSFTPMYENYGSVERVRRTKYFNRGVAINANI
jgi:phage-related tail protein/SLT domain-containing protein